MPGLPLRQKIFAIVVAVSLFVLVVELVRRRKLREEYSWLWLLASLVVLVLALWYDALLLITRLIDAELPISVLVLFSLLFLLVVNIHYSVKISSLTKQTVQLAQKVALMEEALGRRAPAEGQPEESGGGEE